MCTDTISPWCNFDIWYDPNLLKKAIRYYPDIHEKESIIFQGFVNVVVNGDFEHQLENVSVGDCIYPKSWVV